MFVGVTADSLLNVCFSILRFVVRHNTLPRYQICKNGTIKGLMNIISGEFDRGVCERQLYCERCVFCKSQCTHSYIEIKQITGRRNHSSFHIDTSKAEDKDDPVFVDPGC